VSVLKITEVHILRMNSMTYESYLINNISETVARRDSGVAEE
jgi:hypothetical protein